MNRTGEPKFESWLEQSLARFYLPPAKLQIIGGEGDFRENRRVKTIKKHNALLILKPLNQDPKPRKREIAQSTQNYCQDKATNQTVI